MMNNCRCLRRFSLLLALLLWGNAIRAEEVQTKAAVDEQAEYAIALRDEVAYQLVMGRDLETALKYVKVDGMEKFTAEEFGEQAALQYAELTTRPSLPESDLKALVVIGDRYHPPAYIRPPLEKALSGTDIKAAFLYDISKLDADVLREYDLLIVLRDGMIWPNPQDDKPGDPVWWMSNEQENAVAQFVMNGGGFLALHNATALRTTSRDANLYRDVLGSMYNGHGPGDERFEVRIVHNNHPVTSGVTDFVAVDERHNPIMHADNALILLEAVSGDKRSVNAYVRTYGKGRVCHLANGHNKEVLLQSSMQRLIANAAKWCAGAVD